MNSLKFAGISHPYPVKHKRKVPFEPRIEVPADLSGRLLEIGRLDQELDRFILGEQDCLDLLTDAISANIHQSVHLEGNPLGLSEVRKLTSDSMAGHDASTRNRYRREILNHVPVWTAPKKWDTPWTLDSIRRLHSTLFAGVDDKESVGNFRKGPMGVYSDKKEELFVAAPPGSIEEELKSLLDWANTQAGGFAPVVAAGVFFHEFESIHPFDDGNGRTGRVLYHVYMQNHGFPNSYLCKIESKLIHDPELYYRILGWTDHSGSYRELVDFFTDALLESYREAVSDFRSKDLLSRDIDETSKRLLAQAKRRGGSFSLLEARGWVDARSDQTIRKHLNALTEMGALRAVGATKARRYRFVNPLADLGRGKENDLDGTQRQRRID